MSQDPPANPRRVRVRPIEPSDWAAMADVVSQPNVIRNTLQMPHVSLAELKARFEPIPPRMTRLAAEIDGRVIGMAAMSQLERRRSHTGQIGISVHDDFQGCGAGAALMAALIAHADNWLGLKRLELSVLADNARAIALYERFGFTREGVMRAHVFREGAYIDAIAMARVI